MLACFGGGTHRARADEFAVRKELRLEAARLLDGGDIAGFDARATQLRQSRERTPAGIWKLSVFYKGVDLLPRNDPNDADWPRIEQTTAAYLDGHPDSPSAVIAAARVLVARAWAYREAGNPNAFSATIERARELLEKHRQVGTQDPDWFALRIQIMNGQGDSRAAVLAEARNALEVEPTYESTYHVASYGLSPQWGGSAALTQEYMAALHAATSADEGRQTYARAAFNLARIEPHPIVALQGAGFQWPLVRQSLEEITAAYPDPWNRNAERAMACLIGTQEDWISSSARAGEPLVQVEWFDSFVHWSDCAQRQQAAKPLSFAGATREALTATPSRYLFSVVSGAVLLALALLYWRRPAPVTTGTSGDAITTLQRSARSPTSSSRVYRAKAIWRMGQYVAGGFLVIGGLAGVWGFGAVADGLRDEPVGLALAFFSALLACVGGMVIADARVSRLVFEGSTLQIIELWRTRRVQRDEIASRRTVIRPKAPKQLVLEFKDASRKPVKIPLVFATDADFLKWFEPIPDTDAAAAAALDAEIRNSPELGNTPEERTIRFASAKRLATRSALIGPLLYFWNTLYPHPYLLIIGVLVVLPWVGVVLIAHSRGLYQFNGGNDPTRPNLAGAFFSCALFLALVAAGSTHILDWRGLIPWTVVAAVLLAVAIFKSGGYRQSGLKTVCLILLVASMYGFGAATAADTCLDRSATTTYRPTVLRKHTTSGRHRSYELLVQPWGPRSTAEYITVHASLYSQAQVGEPLCVTAHDGALASPWFSVTTCDAQIHN